MASDRFADLPPPTFLWGAFAVLVVLVLLQNFVLITHEAQVVGRVTSSGDVELCVNSAPVPDVSACSAIAFSGSMYNCTVSVTDGQQSSFSYSVARDSGSNVIDSALVMNGSLLSFTPNASMIGNYTLRFTVSDGSGCSIGKSFKFSTVTVNSTVFPGSYSIPAIGGLTPMATTEETLSTNSSSKTVARIASQPIARYKKLFVDTRRACVERRRTK